MESNQHKSQPFLGRFRRIPSLLRLSLFSLMCMTGSLLLFSASLLALDLGLASQTVASAATQQVSGETPVNGMIQAPTPPEVFPGKRLNILVLGIDYNHDSKSIIYTAGARSDTMMVVSLSSDGQILNVVSIPRDLYVPLSETLGSDRINAAYSYGGVKQTRETVSRLLGIPIHRYLIVKVYGAKKVIDALGGLAIDVEKDMDYDDNWGQLHVHLKKGPQRLNGDQVVGYARFRKDNTRIDLEGDMGRMRRQQQVIRALVRSLKDPNVVSRIPQLAQAVKETLETDLSVRDMADLALLYRHFDPSKMRGGQVKGDDGFVGEAMVLIPYEPANNQLVRSLLKDSLDLGLKDIRIRIQNSSGQSGLGNHLADDMTGQGFHVIQADEREGKPARRTQIVVYTPCPRVQQRLKDLFPGAQFRDSASPNNDYDVAITLGNDHVYLARGPRENPPSAQRWGDPAPVRQPLKVKAVSHPTPKASSAPPQPVPHPAVPTVIEDENPLRSEQSSLEGAHG